MATLLARYPEANWTGDGVSGGSWTGGPPKLIFHSTESGGWPDYRGGLVAPHITYHPGLRMFEQHTSLLVAARALRNEPGGVQTNRDRAMQVEIIAYSDKALARSRGHLWIGDLTDENYQDLADLTRWLADNHGVALVTPDRRALTSAEANAPGFRLTASQYDVYSGVLAHNLVPENIHWDTAALDLQRIVDLAKGQDDMTVRKGNLSPLVGVYQKAILGWDSSLLPVYKDDNDYGGETVIAVAAFQTKHELPVNGEVIDVATAVFLLSYHPNYAKIGGGAGTQGPAGPKGAKGAKGDTGFRGLDGQDGNTGPKGATGLKGGTGVAGPVGPAGPKGDKGEATPVTVVIEGKVQS